MDRLRAAFAERYGALTGSHLVEAPGRVNLIGEHIDYNGLQVLPMALQRHVAILYRERSDAQVRIASTEPRFGPREFTLSTRIEPYANGDWGNYVKAAGQAIAERHGSLIGFDGVVHSDVPVAAGLSSSSALVVASALAILHANAIETERLALAELLAEGERYVGTRGGGMDQAICLAARRNAASRIEFHPLRLTAHPIPPEWRFIVAYSLVRAEKSGSVREIYNARTRECQEALQSVVAELAASDRVDSYPELLAEYSVSQVLEAAEKTLDAKLQRRFRHVVSERERVRQAERLLAAYDLKGFGRLMTDSHISLRDDYEVSCAELDELVKIASRAGAAGARMTGAGLGGCIVALAPDKRCARVVQALRDRFYAEREFEGSLDDHLFVAQPSAGASVSAI